MKWKNDVVFHELWWQSPRGFFYQSCINLRLYLIQPSPKTPLSPRANRYWFLFHKIRAGIWKVAFFRKCDSFFKSKSPNLQNKTFQKTYPELEIWICCLLLLMGNLNFKVRIVFWKIFILEIGRFENHIALYEKKPPFGHSTAPIQLYP